MGSARHVMGCRLSREISIQNAFVDVASTIHQSLKLGASVYTSKRLSLYRKLRWGLMDSARHVICYFTQETRAPNACDDVSSTIHRSIICGILSASDGSYLWRWRQRTARRRATRVVVGAGAGPGAGAGRGR